MVPLRPHQIYLDAAKIKAYSQANPQHKLNFSGQDEQELDNKLKESMKTWGDDGESQGGVGQVMNGGV